MMAGLLVLEQPLPLKRGSVRSRAILTWDGGSI